MMVETMLESSQDFGMSSGVLPQWKRELLQRRAARPRGPPPPPPAPPRAPPPAPAPPDDDEELRYGPGIVKRLKSRYLSLALRDAPRRRPSVLRRAASLEHLLDEPAPPAPRAPRPASLVAPPVTAASARRDSVKRARSVDALSRLEAREHEAPPPRLQPAPPPPPPAPAVAAPSPPRAPRPPRRPQPLLTYSERPPTDVVRAALRKFEPGGGRRGAPSARVAAVLRGLAARSSTPEPRAREPSPAPGELSPVEHASCGGGGSLAVRPVSRAALEGIARAGSSVRYSFPGGRAAPHLPPLAAANPVLLARARGPDAAPRRVGVIRPLPPATPPPPEPEYEPLKSPPPREGSESPAAATYDLFCDKPPFAVAQESPPRCVDESPVIKVSERIIFESPELSPRGTPERDSSPPKRVEVPQSWTEPTKKPEERLTNGHHSPSPEPGCDVPDRRARRRPPAAAAAVSVVFNFSSRKEVPDYIENDGVVLRAARRDKLKAGDPGVVVLRPPLEGAGGGSDSEGEGGEGERAPSPCAVRFVNDNVLINGKSSLQARDNRDRVGKLKLQFDDSLTRTFEYPSETSLAEEAPAPAGPPGPPPPAPPAAATAAFAPLAHNTHIASSALARYTPSATRADTFELGVTRHDHPHRLENGTNGTEEVEGAAGGAECGAGGAECGAGGAGAECGVEARSWSEARTHATDLLF